MKKDRLLVGEAPAAIPAFMVPHSNGVNRWWNDAGNRATREFLEGLAR